MKECKILLTKTLLTKQPHNAMTKVLLSAPIHDINNRNSTLGLIKILNSHHQWLHLNEGKLLYINQRISAIYL